MSFWTPALWSSFLSKSRVRSSARPPSKHTSTATGFSSQGTPMPRCWRSFAARLNRGMATTVQLRRAAQILPTVATAVPLRELLAGGYSVALELGITVYDALYVALADR